jgi:hypothetical protein
MTNAVKRRSEDERRDGGARRSARERRKGAPRVFAVTARDRGPVARLQVRADAAFAEEPTRNGAVPVGPKLPLTDR